MRFNSMFSPLLFPAQSSQDIFKLYILYIHSFKKSFNQNSFFSLIPDSKYLFKLHIEL